MKLEGEGRFSEFYSGTRTLAFGDCVCSSIGGANARVQFVCTPNSHRVNNHSLLVKVRANVGQRT